MAAADRQLAKALGMTDAPENKPAAGSSEGQSELTIWEKPAFACLASRIPYGETITEEKLKAIYDGEVFLRSRGFYQVRVRCHELAGGSARLLARIELEPADIGRFCNSDLFDETEAVLKEAGFEYVTLDLGGYVKGKLNGSLQP